MFFLPVFDSPAVRQRRNERREEALKHARPWSDEMQWEKLLVIDASTYKPPNLFPRVEPWDLAKHCRLPRDLNFYSTSASGRFRYVNQLLPRGEPLTLWSSRGAGWVAFNGPVVIPALYDRQMNGGEKWDVANTRPDPWMSFTPAEIISLRPGTSLAKGHTVIAGLGLGWQLVNVLRRPNVKMVTLVEKEKELTDWLLPVIKAQLFESEWAKLQHVLIGDARVEVPELHADVALIDIFPGWGNNSFVPCPNIKKVWVWGSSTRGMPNSIWDTMHERRPW